MLTVAAMAVLLLAGAYARIRGLAKHACERSTKTLKALHEADFFILRKCYPLLAFRIVNVMGLGWAVCT